MVNLLKSQTAKDINQRALRSIYVWVKFWENDLSSSIFLEQGRYIYISQVYFMSWIHSTPFGAHSRDGKR